MSSALILQNGALVLCLMTLVWIASVYKRDASLVDPWWSINFLLIAATPRGAPGGRPPSSCSWRW